MLNDLPKYYQPVFSICAFAMPQSQQVLQKVTILRNMWYTLPVYISLLVYDVLKPMQKDEEKKVAIIPV